MPKHDYVITFAADIEPGREPDLDALISKLKLGLTFKPKILGKGTSIDLSSISAREILPGDDEGW